MENKSFMLPVGGINYLSFNKEKVCLKFRQLKKLGTAVQKKIEE